MNKSALQDIQQSLNAIRREIERVDDETKWAALELMLGTSSSVVALAKKMTKPATKTVKYRSCSKDKDSQARTTTADDAKRHRAKGLHTYSSTTIVTKSTRRQRKTLEN